MLSFQFHSKANATFVKQKIYPPKITYSKWCFWRTRDVATVLVIWERRVTRARGGYGCR